MDDKIDRKKEKERKKERVKAVREREKARERERDKERERKRKMPLVLSDDHHSSKHLFISASCFWHPYLFLKVRLKQLIMLKGKY